MLIDTHIHLDLLPEPKMQIDRAKRHGIGQFLVPGIRPRGWPLLMQTVDTLAGAYAAPGVHPLAAREWDSTVEEQLRSCLNHPKAIAIGEIGLDKQIETPLEYQEIVLRHQLRIAIDCKLPVILHSRRATGRLLQILAEEQVDRVGGIFHAFTGSIETANQAVQLGFALGVGGQATWPEAVRVAEMIRQLPQQWIVLESDAPDQAPHPHRGEINQPAWLCYIHHRLAELRGLSPAETAAITTQNTRRILRLQESLS
ncbi:MAG: TatD family hydrolase [Desulfuromonadales bacterium]|nr:TatD family hydrolase [Desulfuromonadales bacterium]